MDVLQVFLATRAKPVVRAGELPRANVSRFGLDLDGRKQNQAVLFVHYPASATDG